MKILILITLLSVTSQASLTPRQYTDAKRRFALNISDTQWEFYDSQGSSSQEISNTTPLQFVARGPNITSETQPTLTLRIDKGTWKSAKQYSEKWLREFPKFGYELQMSRDSRYGSLMGFEIELTSTQTPRRVRQFIVQQPTEIWIFTCSAHKDVFRSAWHACERILKTARRI